MPADDSLPTPWGVRLDPIVIRAYDPAWPFAFERERERLTPVFDQLLVRPVEHIGSTAVPGLAAKAIIDMLAVVGNIDSVRPVIGRFHELGWHYAPEPGDEAVRYLAFCTPSVARRTHHLHVVEERSEGWRGWLAFRDHLRRHTDSAAEYEDLKRRLAAEHGHDPNDRSTYREGKAEFIRRVTTLALEESRTERLRIETLRPEHAKLLFDGLQDQQLYTFIPEEPPASLEALETRYKELAAGARPESKERWLNWVMFLRDDSKPIGTLQATVHEGRRAAIACVVCARYWRQGFASEGVRWLLHYLYAHEGVHLAMAAIDTRNDASLSLVRRLGFGHHKTVVTDEGEDHVFHKRLEVGGDRLV